MANRNNTPADFIVPLDMNGLSGRMLHMPAPRGKKAEILFVYGQHSSLERWWGMVRYVNRYGAVTMPDLPGFGGMESLYKLGQKPTIDALADYLAAFMKLRYKRKKVAVVGMSLGFVIATRMLQRYPELGKNVALLVSLVGFTHADDFNFSSQRYWFYRISATFFANPLCAFLSRYVCLNRPVLYALYHRMNNAKPKFKATSSEEEHRRFMDFEVWLWQHNDVRTHAFTTRELLTLDNCQKRVDLPVWQICAGADQYFDNHRVEQHMRVVFRDVHVISSKLPNHAPSILADEKAAAVLIPSRLRRVLAKL